MWFRQKQKQNTGLTLTGGKKMKEKISSSLSIFWTDWKNYQCTTGNKQNHTALSDTI